MKLVIVESPTKAKTIGKFLGKDYVIKASMGHVVDLPKSTLAVDTEHDFAPDYQVVADKKKIISELKAAAKTADSIILATDPDREGEAIAYHVAELLKSTTGIKSTTGTTGKEKARDTRGTRDTRDTFKRIVFHEITKEAIEEAFKHPRSLDLNLVNAQTARRVLDRLVGYKLSPLLWQKVRRGLSAGRVQSVALRLIAEREREIQKFGKEQYWTVHALLIKSSEPVTASTFDKLSARQSSSKKIATSSETIGTPRNDNGTEFELIEINNKKIETQEVFHLYDGDYKVTRTTIVTEDQAKKIVDDLQKSLFTVSDVLQKETHRSPQAPYTTSTMQQDAARRLGLNGKHAMSLAQKLYEEGYITYHRTDSVAIAASAVSAFRAFAQKEYGDKYVPEKPKVYSAKQKLAQEAHEAIRPTKPAIRGDVIAQDLGGQYGKLYDLIWRRAIASQMSDAVIESTTVLADAGSYRFKANGSVLVFDGFLKVNPQALQDNRLPMFVKGQALQPQSINEVFHETPPPPRYNDASLIKTLEEKGIGRPSTYAGIVSTIESRAYIERLEGKFSPTPIGVAVNDFLVANFSDIDDIAFTAQMEDELDNIAQGKKEWVPMMRAFYGPLEKKIAGMKDVARVKIETEELDQSCPQCGEKLVVRTGKFGKFISCSGFPTCKFTKPFVEETGIVCPKCLTAGRQGGNVIVKKTRKGRKFFGCSNYPACNFAVWKLEEVKQPPVIGSHSS